MANKIVVTHVKADFDAVASAVAAYRLFNCDYIAVCTEPETAVTQYLQKTGVSLPILRLKQKEAEEFGKIKHLIITDCKQSKRLGHLAVLLDKAERITIFDHHPAYAKDIATEEEYIFASGACVSAIVKLLIDRNIDITPEDATLYLLGIYEDTGLLTFSSTKAFDVRMAAEMIDRGGDVTVITEYVRRNISREQVFVLNELLINMGIIKVGDVHVAYSYASIDEYVDELSMIVNRMMDMEALDVLFVMVNSGPRVVLIGRSKNPQVDASKIVARFGGGGHTAAASANIKDLGLYEAVDMLKITLREHISPVRFVQEIMNCPAKSLDVSASFDDAMNFSLMHNLNNMPVVRDGKTVGILSRKDVLQSIKHGMNHLPISQLMQVEIEVVSPESPFLLAEDIMLNTNQKLIPVESDDRLVGVVTRTDFLRLMHEESIQRSAYEEGTKTRLGLHKTRNIKDILHAELSPAHFKYLKDISEIAQDEGVSLYLVGGFVRDILMGLVCNDMDLVVEGDAIYIAGVYAKKNGARLTIHDKYKTASVTLMSGDKIDFATARTEYYSIPGAVPVVEFSSLRSDLYRRDFTINAMAIRIDGSNFGQLVDYFGGQRDILDRKIRVLHSLSFVDDPTRVFRALRFAARFGFSLGSHTERLMKHAEAQSLFDRIETSGKLFIELKYILTETKYFSALVFLKKYHLLEFIAPKLTIHEFRERQFIFLDELWGRFAKRMGKNTQLWHVRYTLLLADHPPAEFKETLKRLHVDEALAKRLLDIYNRSRFTDKKLKAIKTPKPSELYRIFSKHNDEELLMLGVHLGEKRVDALIDYIEVYKNVSPELNGTDLINMGIPPSRVLGELLNELLSAKLDGIVASRTQEEEYVRTRYEKLKTNR